MVKYFRNFVAETHHVPRAK